MLLYFYCQFYATPCFWRRANCRSWHRLALNSRKTAVRMGILTAGEILVLLLLHALIRRVPDHWFPPVSAAAAGDHPAAARCRNCLFRKAGHCCSAEISAKSRLHCRLRLSAGSAGVPHHRLHHPENQRGTYPFPPQKSAMRKRLLSTTRARSPLPATAP